MIEMTFLRNLYGKRKNNTIMFKSTKLFYNVAPYTERVAANVMDKLRYQGFEVDGVKMPSGDWNISIKKGNLFKAVLGLQTALKITIGNTSPHVCAKVGVGILGQQAIPTVLTVCVWWPFAITQIWGLVKQYKLDETVLDTIYNEYCALSGRTVSFKNL